MKFTLPLLLSLAALSVSVPTSDGASFDPSPGGNPNEVSDESFVPIGLGRPSELGPPLRARADLRAVVGDDGKAYRKRQPTKTVKKRDRVKTVRKREAVRTSKNETLTRLRRTECGCGRRRP
jgi:hypothetical protein